MPNSIAPGYVTLARVKNDGMTALNSVKLYGRDPGRLFAKPLRIALRSDVLQKRGSRVLGLRDYA